MNNMVLTILIGVFALGSSNPAYAKSTGNDGGGGGGGGICRGQKCLTLAQAGLQLNKELSNESGASYQPTAEIIEEYRKIREMLPSEILLPDILGTKDTYWLATERTAKKLRRFYREYQKILSDSRFLKPGFELLAATVEYKTYLLPGFHKLDIRGKVLLLIHEGYIRLGYSVKQTLRYDIELNKYLDLVDKGADSLSAQWNLIKAARNVKSTYNEKTFYFRMIITQQNGQIPVKQLCSNQQLDYVPTRFHLREVGSNSCVIDRKFALANQNLDPEFVKEMEQETFYFQTLDLNLLRNIVSSSFSSQRGKEVAAKMIQACASDRSIEGMLVLVLESNDRPTVTNVIGKN